MPVCSRAALASARSLVARVSSSSSARATKSASAAVRLWRRSKARRRSASVGNSSTARSPRGRQRLLARLSLRCPRAAPGEVRRAPRTRADRARRRDRPAIGASAPVRLRHPRVGNRSLPRCRGLSPAGLAQPAHGKLAQVRRVRPGRVRRRVRRAPRESGVPPRAQATTADTPTTTCPMPPRRPSSVRFSGSGDHGSAPAHLYGPAGYQPPTYGSILRFRVRGHRRPGYRFSNGGSHGVRKCCL